MLLPVFCSCCFLCLSFFCFCFSCFSAFAFLCCFYAFAAILLALFVFLLFCFCFCSLWCFCCFLWLLLFAIHSFCCFFLALVACLLVVFALFWGCFCFQLGLFVSGCLLISSAVFRCFLLLFGLLCCTCCCSVSCVVHYCDTCTHSCFIYILDFVLSCTCSFTQAHIRQRRFNALCEYVHHFLRCWCGKTLKYIVAYMWCLQGALKKHLH